MMHPIHIVSLALSGLAVVAGGLGMVLSFLALCSDHTNEVTAGTAGFVAGAILIGAGLISLAILSPRKGDNRHREPDKENRFSRDPA